MVYDTKNRLLIKGNNHKVKLTKLEHRLLIALSSENLTFYEDISQFMYGSSFKLNEIPVRCIKKLLCKKTGIEIRAINGKGYILETDISYM